MATVPLTERPEKRGPKLGDAASLWNFTPSPGWTKEEAAILKLCLVKYGVGRWVQILETGLLPGKLIQQLNGQTQRLLGQQSLAACTGLQVDIDRIRADNEKRTDVERKCGLIIWSGPNPTKAMKDEWQKETKARYGLTPEQLAEAEAQLEDLAASMQRNNGAGASSPSKGHVPLSDLIETPLEDLSRDQKLLLLKRLRSKLASLVAAYTAKQAGAPITKVHGTPVKRPRPTEVQAGAHGTIQAAAKAPTAETKPSRKKTGAKRRLIPKCQDHADDRSTRKRGRPKGKGDPDFMEADGSGVLASAEQTAFEADMATLQGMGFSRGKAKEALEECNFSVDAAVEWLVSNCVC